MKLASEQARAQLHILLELADERARQDEKWGPQNHPVLMHEKSREGYSNQAEIWKKINAERVAMRNAAGVPPDRNAGWDGILLEEVFEALGEGDPWRIREELVQAGAVVVAMIEYMDRTFVDSKGPVPQ